MARIRKPRPIPVMRVQREGDRPRFHFSIHRPNGVPENAPCVLSEDEARNFLRNAAAEHRRQVAARCEAYRARRAMKKETT